MTRDENQLRLLSIFHYVVAGFAGLIALLPIFYLVLAVVFSLLVASKDSSNGEPLAFHAWVFIIFAIVFMTVGLVFAAFVFTAGRFLGKHRRHSFCLIMAGIECIFFPFGTVLGMFTIIVLMRQSVKQLFVV